MSMIYTIGDTKYVLMYALRSSKHNPHAHPRKYSCAGFDHPAIGIYYMHSIRRCRFGPDSCTLLNDKRIRKLLRFLKGASTVSNHLYGLSPQQNAAAAASAAFRPLTRAPSKVAELR